MVELKRHCFCYSLINGHRSSERDGWGFIIILIMPLIKVSNSTLNKLIHRCQGYVEFCLHTRKQREQLLGWEIIECAVIDFLVSLLFQVSECVMPRGVQGAVGW